ncbi:hypothetical protein TVAG_407640 [Trichomonas vaginalis G3]|uniref:Uncharacterized protein n=1 Tax=Trichomonas vaginalis (strain ATCC PRA-98 / G3) TaxID=412133 RepID=A2F1A6_TRIV3|nr:hypothetical protein TVAGG3_0665540 [Trichomonas vaginalis G3]EAY01335.1 hypothetical protein TVAG_407640 [Trichomonas vaginalis G3]KAI5506805.1 hypothetical protein TVAGG3_0665540 [Trichomonas vaginalis G3]|eukprot:XP_001330193.1 hypothetical protein [Trichomonas vaginalis G3]
MLLLCFKDITLQNFENVEVSGKIQVDSLIYDIESDLFTRIHGDNIRIDNNYQNNSYTIGLKNTDKAKHEISVEIKLKIDSNLCNTTHNDEYFTIYNVYESQIFEIDTNNAYLTINDNEILIETPKRIINPHCYDKFLLFKLFKSFTYQKYPKYVLIPLFSKQSNYPKLINQIEIKFEYIQKDFEASNITNNHFFIEYSFSSQYSSDNSFYFKEIFLNRSNTFVLEIPNRINLRNNKNILLRLFDIENNTTSPFSVIPINNNENSVSLQRKLLEVYPYIRFDQNNISFLEGTISITVTGTIDNGDFEFNTKAYYMTVRSETGDLDNYQYATKFFDETFRNTHPFSVNIPVNSYEVGTHKLYFRGDRDGVHGTIYEFRFTVIKYTIIQKFTKKAEYKSGIDEYIIFGITISSEINKEFSFSYGIDSLSTNTTISLTSNPPLLMCSIPLPTLSIGDHYIKFRVDTIEDQIPFKIIDSSSPELQILTTTTSSNPILYYKGITNEISIEYQMRDEDGKGSFSVYHSLDNGAFTKIDDSYNINDASWYRKSFSILNSLISPSDETVHSISFYLKDNLGKQSTHQVLYFKYMNNPIISLQEEMKTTLTYQVDQTIDIKLIYRDARGNGRLTIYTNIYDINNNNNIVSQNNLPIDIDSSTEKSTTIAVNINRLTYEKQYKIEIKGINSNSEETNYIIHQFIIHLSSPVLTITTTPLLSYTKTKDQFISISGNVKDSNLGEVRLQYKYDNNNEFQEFHLLNIGSVTETKSFTENVPIDQTLSEGSHSLTIRAIDSYNKYHELSPYQFTFKYNVPELEIIDSYDPSNPPLYIKGINGTLSINIKATDYNKVESLKIDFSITNTDYYGTPFNIQMKGEISKVFPLIFDIPTALSENVYYLKILATEINGKTSVVKSYPFNFTYNRPVLKIMNQIKKLYYRDTDKYVHISGEVHDIRCNGSVIVSCNVYDTNNNVNRKTNTIVDIKPECYKSFYLRIPLSHVSDGQHQFSLSSINNENEESYPFLFTANISFQYLPSNIEEVKKYKVRTKFSILATIASLTRK